MAHLPRVWCPAPLQALSEVELDASRAHHLYTVLRRRPGDAVRAWDGDDREGDAEILELTNRRGRVRVGTVDIVSRESPLALTLVQAVGRGDRFAEAMVAAVEAGATAVQPVWTECGAPPMKGERLGKKWRAWQIQLLGAAEQSERTRRPVLHEPCMLQDWLRHARHGVLMHPSGARLGTLDIAEPDALAVVVGPEGGFSEREVALARRSGLTVAQLGPRILRTEHAGPLALAVLQQRFGDY
ncbi:MAG: 16S rRNA (uracil(1498)-N(3))-methyltransferase [Oceanococcaceae bacterium]